MFTQADRAALVAEKRGRSTSGTVDRQLLP